MALWARMLGLGSGKLSPQLLAELEAEGLVLVEEDLGGSLRYDHFKAPGRRSHGKIVPQRFAVGISEERFVVYCRSGRVKLADSPFSNPRLQGIEITADGDRLEILVDYDRLEVPDVSGQIRIRIRAATAAAIADQLRARTMVG